MNSVDRDFEPKGSSGISWLVAYVLLAVGAIGVFAKMWDEVHLRGTTFHALVRVVPLPFFFIVPLTFSLFFRRYIRSALKENLVSERVANNCEYWVGTQLLFVSFLIMLLATWD